MELWTELFNWRVKTESAVRHESDLTVISLKIFLFRGMFLSGGEHFQGSLMCGTTPTPVHKHSNDASMSKRLPEKQNWTQKTCKTRYVPQKYRAEQFPTGFCVSGDVLFCRFCQHNVDCKHVDSCKMHLLSTAHLQNREITMQHMLSNGKISIKGKLLNCNKLKWGKKKCIL